MCTVCDEYDLDLEIHGPAQPERIVEKIKQAVHHQRLRAVDDWLRRGIPNQSPFLDLDMSNTSPDLILYYFQCTECERLFMLHCDIYHGAGGGWCPA